MQTTVAAGQGAGPIESVTAPDRWIRRPETLRLLGVGRTTLDTLIREGRFPRGMAITPKCLVWSLAEVSAWMQERRSERADLPPAP